MDNILTVSHCRKTLQKTGNANSGVETGAYQLSEALHNFHEDEKNSEPLILVSACPLRTSARFLHVADFLDVSMLLPIQRMDIESCDQVYYYM